MSVPRLTRIRALFVFVVGLSVAHWRASTQTTPPGESDLQRYNRAIGPLHELLDKSGDLFSASEKQILQNGFQQITARFTLPPGVREGPAAIKSVRLGCELAM